jgi:hypothetical protein
MDTVRRPRPMLWSWLLTINLAFVLGPIPGLLAGLVVGSEVHINFGLAGVIAGALLMLPYTAIRFSNEI